MEKINFSFGKNWQIFIKRYFTQERLEEAQKSLVEFCGRQALKGKSFIDVGCGSGLFSLAAYRLGASRILSFDVDRHSVLCCEYLRRREGNPENWRIMQGSVLDEGFLSQLGKFDFVYSWGVLHHTGDMWRAMKNTFGLAGEDGRLYIAIYNRTDGFGFYRDGRFGSSDFWVKFKRLYARLPSFFQYMIDYLVMAVLVTGYVLAFRNPLQKIKNHKGYRGMSWRVDIRDWLGGYPYEYARVDEVFKFAGKHGFSLENLKQNGGLMNNEYLFKKIK